MEDHDDLAPIRDQARRFLKDALSHDHLKALLEVPGTFDHVTWREVGALGWPSASVPDAAGGRGLGWGATCMFAEELGRTTGSLPLIASGALARVLLECHDAPSLLAAGQRLLEGETHACLAFTAPGEGGLAVNPTVSLTPDGLFGETAFIPFGASADVALVHASCDTGTCLVLVELAGGGVTRETAPTLDNSRASARLRFTGAPAEIVGNDAPALFWRVAGEIALATAFEQLGGAQACLDLARDYAMERTAFGQPIGRFQAIKTKLAEMYVRIEIARGCSLDALAALDAGEPTWLGLAAGARLAATEAYEFAARESIQTHGAIGITWEAQPHHYYRRSRTLALEWGNALFWREQLMAGAGFNAGMARETTK
ncbi:acyl-CoA dehydrogenase [Pandoraea apista]|uniref:acyl-CoA dehydrogenase family protein n=1 Tax=Pandoraea apista TaxID=93218 RepID=UPI000F786A4E|nr:acyl-CoA dehydrogenase family protein [Pandoraea apista]RRW92404.1 acyl-CoA dehydrogenase [Pandoraea apista]